MLFWDVDNGLKLPVRGLLLSKATDRRCDIRIFLYQSYVFMDCRNQYPVSHGGTCVAFTTAPASHRLEWALVGQEGGDICRGQMSRILNIPRLSEVIF
jgi:hypothetical protein